MFYNYFSDNEKRINEIKGDICQAVLMDVDCIPAVSCLSGVADYEPTKEDMDQYCKSDFLSCPRLQTRPRNPAIKIQRLTTSKQV